MICRQATAKNYNENLNFPTSQSTGDLVPYADSLAPDLTIREQGLLAQQQEVRNISKHATWMKSNIDVGETGAKGDSFPKIQDFEKYFQGVAKNPPTYTNAFIQQYRQAFSSHASDPDDLRIKALKYVGPWLRFCPKTDAECRQAWRTGVDVNPALANRADSNFVQVATDPSFIRPLALLTSRLYEKYREMKEAE